ncbi:MAG: hypothetical protein ACI9YE_003094 [Psychroserpens sp.]|jgi:hypothetical protein
MKKIIIGLFSLVAIVSCNRNGDDVATTETQTFGDAAAVHYTKSEIQAGFVPLNEYISISNKAGASQLNYTYRGYAQPVDLDGTPFNTDDLAASAIFAVENMVFVTWHSNENTNNPNGTPSFANGLGASICAYRLSGIGQYELLDRVDFPHHDFIELSGHRNSGTGYIEILIAGQRDQSNSGYVLNNHLGAVVTRLDFDYINGEFWEESFTELPLTGVAAKDIVAAAKNYYIVTGDGFGGTVASGGVYEVDRSLRNVKNVDLAYNDVQALIVDPTTVTADNADLYVLNRSSSSYEIFKYSITANALGVTSGFSNGSRSSISTGSGVGFINAESADLTWAQGQYKDLDLSGTPITPIRPVSNTDSLIISAGESGIWSASSTAPVMPPATAGVQTMVFSNVKNRGPVFSTAFDNAMGILYCADSDVTGNAGNTDGGVEVYAMGEYEANAGPVLNQFDLIGKFVPPTTINTSPPITVKGFQIKEISIFNSRNIALAAGDGGVYFIQKDSN